MDYAKRPHCFAPYDRLPEPALGYLSMGLVCGAVGSWSRLTSSVRSHEAVCSFLAQISRLYSQIYCYRHYIHIERWVFERLQLREGTACSSLYGAWEGNQFRASEGHTAVRETSHYVAPNRRRYRKNRILACFRRQKPKSGAQIVIGLNVIDMMPSPAGVTGRLLSGLMAL
jgi:hypothetical protein